MANFQLTWDVPSSDGNSPIKDYVIQYRQVGSPTWLLYSDSISTSNTATVEGLAGCLNYEFRIAAKNATGISGFSNNASKILGFIPSGVSNLNVVDSVVVTDISLNVSWSAPPNDGGCTINDYIIEYSTNSGSSWTRVTDGVNNNTSYTITGLSVGTYLVRIAPISVVGIGPFVTSSPITATTTPPPGVMSIVQQPAHYKVSNNESATFSTQAISSNGQPPQYQWQLAIRTGNLEIVWINIPNATSSTLTTSMGELYDVFYSYGDIDFSFYPGFLRCQTTAISCNTIHTEYVILFDFFSFWSTGGIFSDFDDGSFEFYDTAFETINGVSYAWFDIPNFEIMGIYQSLYNQTCLDFIPNDTKVASIYTQKSVDATNWENLTDYPVEIFKTSTTCNNDAGPTANFTFTNNETEYYRSFIMDTWPILFTNYLGGDNVISSLYSNQEPSIVYDDVPSRVKITWQEQQTLCVTNTQLSTFPGSISFNRTYTGYKPLIKSEEYSNRLSLQYRPNEGIWYLSDSNTPVFYTSVSSDLLGTWNDTQSDGFPPIIVSGVCPTTTTTTTTTTAPLTLTATGAGDVYVNNQYSNTYDANFHPITTVNGKPSFFAIGPISNTNRYIYFVTDQPFGNMWVISRFNYSMTPDGAFRSYYIITESDLPPENGWVAGGFSGPAPAPTISYP